MKDAEKLKSIPDEKKFLSIHEMKKNYKKKKIKNIKFKNKLESAKRNGIPFFGVPASKKNSLGETKKFFGDKDSKKNLMSIKAGRNEKTKKNLYLQDLDSNFRSYSFIFIPREDFDKLISTKKQRKRNKKEIDKK